MNIKKLLKELGGDSSFSNLTGMGARIDYSGERGGMKRPLIKRGSTIKSPGVFYPEKDVYPYDREVFYGSPQAYDRGSGGKSAMHKKLTPHCAIDSSAWEEIGEAMGTPQNIGMANRGSGLGAGTGVPGGSSARGWAGNPMKAWEETEDEMDENYASSTCYADDGSHPEQDDKIPSTGNVGKKDKDSSFHLEDDKPADIFVIGTPNAFMQGIGHSVKSIRGMGGLMPKESAWDWLNKFISNK